MGPHLCRRPHASRRTSLERPRSPARREAIIEVHSFTTDTFAAEAAARIAQTLPRSGSVVLTGGTTVGSIYAHLAQAGIDWSSVDVYFSDERCVPPDSDASNFSLAQRTLLHAVAPQSVQRMRGEDPPADEARRYDDVVRAGAPDGFELVLLGLGSDAHIAALFPGSDALAETDAMCAAVARPDGLDGLTLTPPALVSGAQLMILVAGESKAAAVYRLVSGSETPGVCPARLLADHPSATLLADEAAASAL